MKRLYILFVVMTFCSCEREVEFPFIIDGGRLHLVCFPSNGSDSTYIELSAAVPVTNPGGSRNLSSISIDFAVNGKTYIPKYKSEHNNIYTYTVSAHLYCDDEVSIKASADGYPPISSVSYMPEGVPIVMKREIYNYGTLRHIFTVKREDNDGDKHYYGILIKGLRRMEKVFVNPDKEPEVETTPIVYEYEMNSSIESEGKGLSEYKPIIQTSINGKPIILFEDDGGKTREIFVTVDIPFTKDMYREINQEYTLYRRTLYEVECYNVSKAVYEYLNPPINKAFLGAGLVPPVLYLGNIVGGYGINACIACISSGWISNIEISSPTQLLRVY